MPNHEQNIIFYQAILQGDEKRAEAALALGADINYQTNIGFTALTRAAMNQNFNTIQWLLERGAKTFFYAPFRDNGKIRFLNVFGFILPATAASSLETKQQAVRYETVLQLLRKRSPIDAAWCQKIIFFAKKGMGTLREDEYIDTAASYLLGENTGELLKLNTSKYNAALSDFKGFDNTLKLLEGWRVEIFLPLRIRNYIAMIINAKTRPALKRFLFNEIVLLVEMLEVTRLIRNIVAFLPPALHSQAFDALAFNSAKQIYQLEDGQRYSLLTGIITPDKRAHAIYSSYVRCGDTIFAYHDNRGAGCERHYKAELRNNVTYRAPFFMGGFPRAVFNPQAPSGSIVHLRNLIEVRTKPYNMNQALSLIYDDSGMLIEERRVVADNKPISDLTTGTVIFEGTNNARHLYHSEQKFDHCVVAGVDAGLLQRLFEFSRFNTKLAVEEYQRLNRAELALAVTGNYLFNLDASALKCYHAFYIDQLAVNPLLNYFRPDAHSPVINLTQDKMDSRTQFNRYMLALTRETATADKWQDPCLLEYTALSITKHTVSEAKGNFSQFFTSAATQINEQQNNLQELVLAMSVRSELIKEILTFLQSVPKITHLTLVKQPRGELLQLFAGLPAHIKQVTYLVGGSKSALNDAKEVFSNNNHAERTLFFVGKDRVLIHDLKVSSSQLNTPSLLSSSSSSSSSSSTSMMSRLMQTNAMNESPTIPLHKEVENCLQQLTMFPSEERIKELQKLLAGIDAELDQRVQPETKLPGIKRAGDEKVDSPRPTKLAKPTEEAAQSQDEFDFTMFNADSNSAAEFVAEEPPFPMDFSF